MYTYFINTAIQAARTLEASRKGAKGDVHRVNSCSRRIHIHIERSKGRYGVECKEERRKYSVEIGTKCWR